MKIKVVYLFFFLEIFSATLVFAGNEEKSKPSLSDTIALDEVVVTGSNFATTKNTLPFSINVVGKEKLESMSESKVLSALSGQIPSLFVTERGVTGFGVSTGGSGGIKIRGVGGSPTSQVLMMVDGQPQFAGVYSHHVGDAYPSEYVERVEVVRGPASVLYGSNAMGGVINVITKASMENGVHGSFSTMYGSYNTSKSGFSASAKQGKFSSMVSLGYDRTDGTRDYFDFKQASAYGKIGYDFSDHWRAKLDYSLTKFEGNDPSYMSNEYPDPYHQSVVRGATSFNLDNHYGATSGSAKVFYSYGNHFIYDPKPFHSLDDHLGVMLYQSFSLFEGNHVTAGFDFTHYTGSIPLSGGVAYTEGSMSTMSNKSITEYDPYIVASQSIMNDALTFNAGVRYVSNDMFGSLFVPQGGLALRAFEGSTVKLAVSKGYRNPSFKELYLYKMANTDLKPESMLNYEISVAQYFLDGALSVELTGYLADGKDLIQSVPHPELGHPLNENTGSFTNKGVELMTSYVVSENLNMNASYSYLNSSLDNLTGAPKNQFFVGANWKALPKLMFDMQLKWIDGLYVAETIPNESYLLLNAKVTYQPIHWLEAYLLLDNITDQEYTINYGYPMPGFMAFAGVKVRF